MNLLRINLNITLVIADDMNWFAERIGCDLTGNTGLKSLLEFAPKKSVKIVSIVGGKGSRQILAQLGIGVGSKVKIKRNAPFAGALLIENHGTSVAVGRGVAAKILVEEI